MALHTNPAETAARLLKIGEAVYARGEDLPVIVQGSPEWAAWRQWRLDHGLPVGLMDRQGRCTVPLKWPPVNLDEAEAKMGGGLGSKLQQ